jgi:putative sterol carrier protein
MQLALSGEYEKSGKSKAGFDTPDVLAVANGELDPTKAFMQGKAKVKGDLTEAMGLIKMFKLN